MHEVYFTLGGFVGGFVTCWLVVARIKNELTKAHEKLDAVLAALKK